MKWSSIIGDDRDDTTTQPPEGLIPIGIVVAGSSGDTTLSRYTDRRAHSRRGADGTYHSGNTAHIRARRRNLSHVDSPR
jgi:hypothetical protein